MCVPGLELLAGRGGAGERTFIVTWWQRRYFRHGSLCILFLQQSRWISILTLTRRIEPYNKPIRTADSGTHTYDHVNLDDDGKPTLGKAFDVNIQPHLVQSLVPFGEAVAVVKGQDYKEPEKGTLAKLDGLKMLPQQGSQWARWDPTGIYAEAEAEAAEEEGNSV